MIDIDESDSDHSEIDVGENLNDLLTSNKPLINHKRQRTHINGSSKTFCETVADKDTQDIPTYLLPTNQQFEQMIQNVTHNTMTCSINIDELRHVAILIHHSMTSDLKRTLWTTFLKSGTGLLKTKQQQQQQQQESNGPKMWPSLLKSMIKSCSHIDHTEKDVTDEICLNIVQTQLRRLEYQYEYYQNELKEKIKPLSNYEITIAPILQTFIQQNLQSLQIAYEFAIEFIGYEYEDQRLAFQIKQQQKLNDHQIQFIENLCSHKYESEKSQQEVKLFQKYLEEKKLPASFNSIHIPLPSFIQTLDDSSVRQYLIHRHQQIIHRYKNDMITIYRNISQVYMCDAQKIFDDSMAKLWREQHSLPIDQQFHSVILNLIEQRLTNITDKVQSMYRYKLYPLCGKISSF
ncbi:unnamed protein product [Rotaria sp. Silwood2]|nr:unnamed protein product [Rotaria sp. Silwood2]CAF4123194.1 unnamed protein product [Rotaria sp. Silwood2]